MIRLLLRMVMAVLALPWRFFSIGPRIFKDEGALVAVTGWLFGLLTLGAMLRRVTVEAGAEVVQIRSRYLWLVGWTRTIDFRDIQAVTYGYDDWFGGEGILWEAHDTLDVYQVGLCLKDDREVHLFTFIGEGAFGNGGPLPGWFDWPQYGLELDGGQQSESRLLVELLGKMIGVAVQPPRF